MAIPVKGPIQATQEKNKVVSTIVIGQQAVAVPTTAEALAATTKPLVNGITVRAFKANTDLVFVGLSTVTPTNGFILEASEEVFIPIDDAMKIFVDAVVATEGVSFIGS